MPCAHRYWITGAICGRNCDSGPPCTQHSAGRPAGPKRRYGMRRPSKLSTSLEHRAARIPSGRGRRRPSACAGARRARRVQTSVESSGGPAVTVSEPSGAKASAETTPPGSPATRSPSSHSSLSPPRLTVQARRARARRRARRSRRRRRRASAARGSAPLPQHGQPRELAAGVARAEHGAVGQQPRRVEGDLAVVRREVRQPRRSPDRRGRGRGRTACSRAARGCRAPTSRRRATSRRAAPARGRPLAGDGDDRDVEVDAVAAGVRERDAARRRARTRPGRGSRRDRR